MACGTAAGAGKNRLRFCAAEYTDSAMSNYDNVHFDKRDEDWYREYYRINLMFMKGKKALGRGDDTVGVRVPLLATQAGLDVYDVRLNDRAMHVFPPYRHEKQRNYLKLSKTANAAETDEKWERLTVETVTAGGGTEEDTVAGSTTRSTAWESSARLRKAHSSRRVRFPCI